MTTYINEKPRQDILWSPPEPLHVAMIREAKEAYKAAENAKDETRKHLIEEKA